MLRTFASKNTQNGPTSSAKDQKIRVEATKKGKGGKIVTLIKGLESLPNEGAKSLLKKLKASSGVGGKINNGVLELQGDHADNLVLVLNKLGFMDVKKAGGSGKNAKPTLKWNSPKHIREEAEKIKEEEQAKKIAEKAAKRAASKTPEAIAKVKRTQLEKSRGAIEEQLTNGVSSEQEEKLRAKLERINQQLNDLD
eukprot:CAMPEP_0197517446 /NCGR_PEP_ID=MMETSP1318-20131121/2458_1 /TAXON_ID=552666 /ORGANISM="Partenskyella glossopodia, Strain RCC365" /LENGTH=195 /DNA_ID=CAMNT_0043067011 /DNA_START=302 /DNA_END=889 /DNA_ORIENTATION=+